MRKRKIMWLVIVLVFLALNVKAQVIKIENGFAITDLKIKNSSNDWVYPYQVSLGLDYMDREWYGLSSQIGFLRKGTGGIINRTGEWGEAGTEHKLQLDYLTMNTTFRIKTPSVKTFVGYLGCGPRVDVFLKGRMKPNVSDFEVKGMHKLIAGLKVEAGFYGQFDRMQVGLNFGYLPSFVKPYGGKNSGIKDRTFTLGLVVGYVL